MALAVFLSFLVYLGWEGGTAGTALVDGLKDLVGQVHVLVPVALLAAGAIVVMRPVLPAVRPFRTAAACLLLSCCLAFAAGTFGLGGISAAREDRGGLLGEWLYEGTSTLLGSVGAHIDRDRRLPRRRAAAHGREHRGRAQGHRRPGDHDRPPRPRARRAGALGGHHAHAHRARGARRARDVRVHRGQPPAGARAGQGGLLVRLGSLPRPLRGRGAGGGRPEPEPQLELEPPRTRRGAGGGAAPRGGPRDRRARRDARRAGPPGGRGGPHARRPLPRLGHRLAGVRLDDPRPALPDPLDGRREPARHGRAGEDRRPARRGAGPLRRAGAGHRHGRGPAHHPLRAPARARHQGRQGRAAQGRPRLRAGRLRHPHPRPDPRQAGRRRRGPERAPPHRPPRRRPPGRRPRAGRR